MEQVNLAITDKQTANIEQELVSLWQKRKDFLRAKILAQTIKNILFIGVLVAIFLGVTSVTLGVSFLSKIAFILSIVLLPLLIAWNIFEKQIFNTPATLFKSHNIDAGANPINYLDKSFLQRLALLPDNFDSQNCILYLQKLIQKGEVRNGAVRVGINPDYVIYVAKKMLHATGLNKENCLTILAKVYLYAIEYAKQQGAFWVYPYYELLGFIETLQMQEELALNGAEFIDFLMYGKLLVFDKYLQERKKLFSRYLPNYRPTGLLDDWFTGFTFYIGQFTIGLSEYLQSHPGVYAPFHKQAVAQVIQTMLKPNNPYALLVGDPGVGKSSVVYALTQRILEKDVPEPLINRRVLKIDVNKFLASIAKYPSPAMFIQYLEQELRQGPEVILFIDEMERILEDANYHNLILGLFPLLSKYRVPLIGTVNTQFYNILKKQNSNLLAYFDTIKVQEPSAKTTYEILLTKIHEFEHKYRIFVFLPAIRVLIDLVKKYVPAERLPKSAFNVFEKACVLATTNQKHVLDIQTVHNVMEQIVGSKVAVDSQDFAKTLMNIKDLIHKQYINQEEAVEIISNALLRNYAQISNKKRPVGVFLFAGTTGVGKTYLAKTVSKILFGENFQIIRVDLGQYKLVSDVQNVLEILSKIRLAPASLVLLDEFEKAHPALHDIFLRLFDEGVLQDPSTGEDLYFNNSLVIATSNVGSDILLQSLENLTDASEQTVKHVFEQVKEQVKSAIFQAFKPELLNRFDAIVIFEPLSKDNLRKIAKLAMQQFEKELYKQNIKLKYNDNLINLIVEKSYNPALGARPINRFIEQTIKTLVANYIVQYKAKYGRAPGEVDLTDI